MDYMRKFKDLSKSVVPSSVTIAFSKCNPMTSAHLQLVEKLNSVSKVTNSIPVFFISKSNDSILSEDFKSSWCHSMSPDTVFVNNDDNIQTYYEFIESISHKYPNINLIINANEDYKFSTKINQILNSVKNLNVIHFNEVNLEEAEESARSLIENKEEFLESFDIDASSLYEELTMGCVPKELSEREEFIAGKFKVGDFVVSHDNIHEVLGVGTNYLTLIDEAGVIDKIWPKEVSHTPYSMSPKYFNSSTDTSLFLESMEEFDSGKFDDKMALVNAYRRLDEYYLNKDTSKFYKFKELIENINQTERFANLIEEEEIKMIDPKDRMHVARVIADTYGVTEGETPEELVKAAHEKFKAKDDKSEEVMAAFKRMLAIASSVGIEIPPETDDCECGLDESAEKLNEIAVGHAYIKKMFDPYENRIKHVEVKVVDYTKHLDKPDRVHYTYKGKTHSLAVKVFKSKLIKENTVIPTSDYKLGKDGRKYPAHRIVIKDVEKKVEESMDHLDAAPNYSDHEQIDTLPLDFSQKHDDELNNISDEELDLLIHTYLNDDDFMNIYEDTDISIIDEETGETLENPETSEIINEVLSRAERIKSRIRFHRTASKRERKLKVALNKKSDNKTLIHRARRLAVHALELRLARKPLDTLSLSEKERIEKRIQNAKPILNRLTIRLMSKVRHLEQARLREGFIL